VAFWSWVFKLISGEERVGHVIISYSDRATIAKKSHHLERTRVLFLFFHFFLSNNLGKNILHRNPPFAAARQKHRFRHKLYFFIFLTNTTLKGCETDTVARANCGWPWPMWILLKPINVSNTLTLIHAKLDLGRARSSWCWCRW